MNKKFVQTSNVKRFLAAAEAVEQRGAPEAVFLLVHGDAGFGKTNTAEWWGLKNDAVFIRCKAAYTPHWFLSDLVSELKEAPARSSEKMFAQALGLLGKSRRPLVIDEVENAIGANIKVIDTIRDLSDFLEIPVVLCGRDHVKPALQRKREVWTRISGVAEFGPLTLDDVALCCAEMARVQIGPDVVAEIHRQAEGYIREVVKAIRNVELIGRKVRDRAVTVADIGGQRLTHEWQRRGVVSYGDKTKGAAEGAAA